MIDCSPEYRAAIVGDSRKMYIQAIIDLISPDIVYGDASSQTSSKYSKPEQLHDKVMQAVRHATLERNRWLLDGSYRGYPDDPADLTSEVGYQSAALSGEAGSFSVPQFVRMNFSGVEVLQAISVYFPGAVSDGVPRDFVVSIRATDNEVYYTKTFEGNTAPSISLSGFTVYSPASIEVNVSAWSLPYRRMRVMEIIPGIYETWTQRMISEINVRQQVNFACTALPYGTATISIKNDDRRFEPRNKSGVFLSITDRQEIPIMVGPELPDGSVEYKQVGVFYQYSGGWKTGENRLTITWELVDIVGLLAERDYVIPDTLPTTLSGWLANLVSQLGVNFSGRYRVNAAYADVPVSVRQASDLNGQKCGDVLRYACMAAGCFPFADANTGYLAAEPLWNSGNRVTLDNMPKYPVMRANNDLGYVQFTLNDGHGTVFRVGGNSSASSETLSNSNPFIQTKKAALTAAKNILACYGGNQIEISGRGDPASECGDVDSIQLDESQATSARRMNQTISFSDGVMQNLPAVFLQADGSYLFNSRVYLTGEGTWTAPTGVTNLFVIIGGGGDGGEDGTAGTMEKDGKPGAAGRGGYVYAGTIGINDGQSFTYSCGDGGAANGGKGAATTFGTLTSASGRRYNGYTDIRSGDVYARDGVKAPLPGSGDGGKGGKAGRRGRTTTGADGNEHTTRPTPGGPGVAGQSGFIVIWYAVPESDAGGTT